MKKLFLEVYRQLVTKPVSNFKTTKKTVSADKGQTISRPSCLTVTVTRIFHRFTSLHWLTPDYFRWHFSHSQNTFFRDMKRLRLFVLLFYHIRPRFTTKPTGSKPLQNRYKRYRFEIVKVGFTVPFGLWMMGERLGLSKARSNFDVMYKRLNFTKFLRVPVRADL